MNAELEDYRAALNETGSEVAAAMLVLASRLTERPAPPPPPDQRWRDIPIEEDLLPPRAENALCMAGLKTMGEVDDTASQDLLMIRNFGKTTLRDTRQRIRELKMEYGA